ncbi:hypothetical protein AB4305_11275 [Nocardia sp. 2YAB30]|uniref:hypothetical protein n=1 Tax=unclassified Nocardia TaxID=2637762 RepID=UPI003F945601
MIIDGVAALALCLLAGTSVGELLDVVDGTRTVTAGLATLAVPIDRLDSATADIVSAIAANPPAAVRAAKWAIDNVLAPLRDNLREQPTGPAADDDAMRYRLGEFPVRIDTAS